MHSLAQCKEILWKFQIPSFTYLAIAMTKLQKNNNFDVNVLNHLSHRAQIFNKLFLTLLTRIRIWNIITFVEKYQRIVCKTKLPRNTPFTRICVLIWCRVSDTGIIMASQRRCYARDPKKTCIDFLQGTVCHRSLRNFAGKFRLRNVSKPFDSCHNRI